MNQLKQTNEPENHGVQPGGQAPALGHKDITAKVPKQKKSGARRSIAGNNICTLNI